MEKPMEKLCIPRSLRSFSSFTVWLARFWCRCVFRLANTHGNGKYENKLCSIYITFSWCDTWKNIEYVKLINV